jgi:hypothetical protein
VVVLAEAKAVSGAFQDFAVVKVLKGDGPDVVRLRVADQPADEGRLQLLFMRPQTGGGAEASAEATTSPTPGATETTSTLVMLTVGVPIMYSYQGEAAMARAFPAGTDPAAVELP